MQIEPLANHQHLIPTIAKLLHEEWHDFGPWSATTLIEARFQGACGQARMPCGFVAVDELGQFMGTASIKLNEIPSHRDKQHWLGEVFVPKPLRGRGIASAVVRRAVDYALTSGVKRLHLYTPDQQPFYRRLGWRDCGQDIMNAEPVTIMFLDLSIGESNIA
jgi:predicted N-acetyltransferase YhbS